MAKASSTTKKKNPAASSRSRDAKSTSAAKKKASKKKASKKKTSEKPASAKKAAKKRAAKKKAAAPAKKKSGKAQPAQQSGRAKPPLPAPAEEGTGAQTQTAEATSPIPKQSRAKRRRVVRAVLPKGTSARMADAARASVWSISSEKTVDQFEAADELERHREEIRTDGLVELTSFTPPPPELRRCTRDVFEFFREEMSREDREDDPQAVWRTANERLRHELTPGIDPDELALLEERIRVAFPPSYWDFSLEWSGGFLYVRDFGHTRIISALHILDEVRGPLSGRMTRPHLPVVDLGCGDYLALDMSKESRGSERPIYWWFGKAQRKVADSFGQWLKRYVESDGQPYWWL